MPDEMFFSEDSKCLRRGRRRQARTPTCRPCLIWPKDAPDLVFHGVVIDINPYGMRIRMYESLPPGTGVMVQLMRDEEFTVALALPVEGLVVRNKETAEGLFDHGVQIRVSEIKHAQENRPIRLPHPSLKHLSSRSGQTRMHIFDIAVGNRRTRRTEK